MVLEFTVNKSCNTVFDYLVNMQMFVTVHPIIFRIEKVKDNKYLIHEKLKMLFIPVVFKYKAVIHGDRLNNKVSIMATVMRMVHINMNFELREDNGQTHVKEDISFKSLLPVHFVMRQIFRKQHALLFENISNT